LVLYVSSTDDRQNASNFHVFGNLQKINARRARLARPFEG
jgi:hypothetical protein